MCTFASYRSLVDVLRGLKKKIHHDNYYIHFRIYIDDFYLIIYFKIFLYKNNNIFY